MKLIVNHQTKESIPYKFIKSLKYECEIFDKIEFEGISHENLTALLFSEEEPIKELFEKYNKKDINIYLIERMLLIVFKDLPIYYSFNSLHSDLTTSISEEKKICFGLSEEDDMEYHLVLDSVTIVQPQ